MSSSTAIADEVKSDEHCFTPYERWVRRLYMTNLFHPVKLGLQNMHKLHEALGNPMDNTTVIHVAGTNGKGSVVYKIAQALLQTNNEASNDSDDSKLK